MSAQAAAITPSANKSTIGPTPAWLTMSKEERADWLRHTGKGYLSREEQAERLRLHHGDIESVYIAEAWKAHEAKDDEVFWQWFSLLVAPAHALKSLKESLNESPINAIIGC